MNPARSALAAVLALAVTGAFATAFAAWPNDPGVNVRIAVRPYDQWFFNSVEDGAGGAFISWSEGGDIRAQHLTAQGLVAPGWPAGGFPVCVAASAQYPSSMVADGAGGFIVAWDDYRDGSGASNVYAQRVGPDGSLLWTADGVAVCTAADYQFSARLCSDRAGGAVIVWNDRRDYATLASDLYAQRLSSSGAPLWPANGRVICALAGDQESPSVVGDGTVGGAYVVWRDFRAVDMALYASRLGANGDLRPGWTTDGTLLCGVGNPSPPSLISDGAFGAFVTWSDSRTGDFDIRAMRMTGSGPVAPGWTPNGVAVTADPVFQIFPVLASDGAGGAIVAWYDTRNGDADAYAQHITAGAALTWPAGGVALTRAPGDQFNLRIVPDGAGGAVVGWHDSRAGTPPMVFAQRITGAGSIASGFAADGNAIATAHWVQELAMCSDGAGGAILAWQHNSAPQAGYAQRIDRWGCLGAQPRIAGVRDVPNDQGGRVKLSWDRSPLDAYPGNSIDSYLVYRSVPQQAALAALARGEAVLEGEETAGEASNVAVRASGGARRSFAATQLAGATYYWEYLASVAAGQLPGYSYLAATAQDSVAGSNPSTLFMVRAQDSAGGRYWFSDADSGYSTDDLAPAAPAPFTGAYAAGATHLHWAANGEADLAGYRLYRGTTAGFVPSPASLVASLPDTGYADGGAAGYFYKLTAVDAHGNESAASLLAPSGTLAVAPGTTWPLALAPSMPNPSAGSTTCRFTLPAEGPVRLAVYDAAGRLVRVLADAQMAAGEHAIRWDGARAEGGRAPSGLYLARLTFAGRMLTQKMVRVE